MSFFIDLDKVYLHKDYLCDYSWEIKLRIPKNVMFTSLCRQKYLLKYTDRLFSLIFDEGELTIRTNNWFFHIKEINE